MQKICSIGTNERVDHCELWEQISIWKPWRWLMLDLIFTMRDIYISSNFILLPKYSTKFKAPSLKMVNISLTVNKTILLNVRTKSCVMKSSTILWVWYKFNVKWDNNMIRIYHWRGNHYRLDTRFRANKWIQRSRIRSDCESHIQGSD